MISGMLYQTVSLIEGVRAIDIPTLVVALWPTDSWPKIIDYLQNLTSTSLLLANKFSISNLFA